MYGLKALLKEIGLGSRKGVKRRLRNMTTFINRVSMLISNEMRLTEHVGGEINIKFKPQNPERKYITNIGVHRMIIVNK
jgi:hypothetical protein